MYAVIILMCVTSCIISFKFGNVSFNSSESYRYIDAKLQLFVRKWPLSMTARTGRFTRSMMCRRSTRISIKLFLPFIYKIGIGGK